MPGELAELPKSEGTTKTQEHTLSVLLQKIVGQDGPNLTEAQVDEILSQRRQVTDYIHEDRKSESFDAKFYLVTILVFILLLSGGVLLKYPDLFSEVLGFMIGLFGGGFGGYGLGKRQS